MSFPASPLLKCSVKESEPSFQCQNSEKKWLAHVPLQKVPYLLGPTVLGTVVMVLLLPD